MDRKKRIELEKEKSGKIKRNGGGGVGKKSQG